MAFTRLARLALLGFIVAVVVAAASGASAAQRTYRVRAGDTLWALAHRFHTSVGVLARSNRLDPDAPLQVGDVLVIPGSAPVRLYRVRAGDTLTGIAARFHTTVAGLARANHLDPAKPLLIGAVLQVPGSSAPAAAQAAAPAARYAALDRRLAHALADPYLRAKTTGVMAVDLATGAVVFAQHADLSLDPASPEKLPVAYTALKLLGADFRIGTDVLGSGTQHGSTWVGSLILQGHGDPTLDSAALARLAAAVRARGIRRIKGSVLGDESYFDSERTVTGWKAEFYGNESPPLSALAVDRDAYGGHLAPHPPLAAALLFVDALRAAGVAVTGHAAIGVAPPGSSVVARATSPSLGALVTSMDRTSDNFAAELLLKQLGRRIGGSGTSAAGAAVVRRTLAANGVPLAGVTLVDGSGLSQGDRLTARALVALLAAAQRDRATGGWLRQSLPLAGVDGTLGRRLKTGPAYAFVRAKTGSTDIASALVGYAGTRFAFAILMNARPAIPMTQAHEAQDRFAQIIAALARG